MDPIIQRPFYSFGRPLNPPSHDKTELGQWLQKEMEKQESIPLSKEAFAALHGHVSLEGTPFLGTDCLEETLHWWTKTLSRLEQQPGPLGILKADTTSSSPLVTAWKQDLRQMEEALALLKSGAVKELKNLISKELNQHHRFLLPIPFKNHQTGLMHAMGCVFEKGADGLVRFRLLDKSSAAEREHPALKIDGGKVKRSYSDLPMRLRDPHFLQTEGLISSSNAFGDALFGKLCALAQEKSTSTPAILYGLFHSTVGEVHPEDTFGENKVWFTEEMAASMALAETSVHQLARLGASDQIKQGLHPADLREFKRLSLAVKIQSWLEVAKSLKEGKLPSSLPLLERCLKDFSFTIEKSLRNNLLDEEEFLFCRSLQEEIGTLFALQSKPKVAHPVKSEVPSIEEENTVFSCSLPKISEIRLGSREIHRGAVTFSHEPITADNITEVLQRFVEFAKEAEATYRFQIVNTFFLKLSLDPLFWEQIPEEKIKSTLTLLKRSLQAAAPGLESEAQQSTLYPELHLMAATGLFAADCLARRLRDKESLHLEGFVIDFPDQSDMFYFHHAQQASRWHTLRKHFAELKKTDRRPFLLSPFSETPETWKMRVEEVKDEKYRSSFYNMLRYLEQFTGIHHPNDIGLFCIEREDVGKGWTKKNETTKSSPYPDAFLDYYYFHLLGSGFLNTSSHHLDTSQKFNDLLAADKIPVSTVDTKVTQEEKGTTYSWTYKSLNQGGGNNQSRSLSLKEQRLEISSQLSRFFGAEMSGGFTVIVENESVKKTENRLTITSSEEVIPSSEIYVRDLQKIAREPHLQISMCINWCQAHPEALEFAEVQNFIECLFLREGSPIEKLRDQPFLQQQVFSFLHEKIEQTAGKLASLESHLFWIRLTVHVMERCKQPKEVDQDLEKMIEGLEKTFRHLQEQVAGTDFERFQKIAYAVTTHLAYLSSRFHQLSSSRAEAFVGWQMLRSLMSAEGQKLPYWMEVDLSQFLITRSEELFPLVESFQTLPYPFRFLQISAFSGVGAHPKIKMTASGVFDLLGEGHSLQLDLFNKTIFYDGKEVSLARGFLSYDQKTAVNAWSLHKKQRASAEALLSRWLGKSVQVVSIQVRHNDNKCFFETAEGQTYVLEVGYNHEPKLKFVKLMQYPDLSIEFLVHPKGTKILSQQELELWRTDAPFMPAPSLLKVNAHTLEMTGGSTRILLKGERLEIQEKILIAKEGGWYKEEKMLESLPAPLRRGTLWVGSQDNLHSLPRYLLTLKGVPAVEIEPQKEGGKVYIWKLSPDGKRTGERLVETEKRPHIPFLENSAIAKEALYWAKGNQISKVESPVSGLSFVFDGQHWSSPQMEGYVVQEEESTALGSLTHGIVLKSQTDTLLLLPCKELKEISWLDGAYKVSEKSIGGAYPEQPYATFKQDPVSLEWQGVDDTSHLYLAYVYLSLGQEEMARKALQHLKMSKPWTPQQWELFGLIASLPNHTPEAVALKMRVACLVLERPPRFGEPPLLQGALQSDFWASIAKEMPRFLNLHSGNLSHIPPHFQLTEEEMTKVLSAIQTFSRNDEGPNPSKPAALMEASTHYAFLNKHKNPKLSQEYAWNSAHFWETLYFILTKKPGEHLQSHDRRIPLFSADIHHLIEERLRKDFMFSGGYCNGLGPIPNPNPKKNLFHPEYGHYDKGALEDNFWPILEKICKDVQQKKVHEVDLELASIYYSLMEEALRDERITENFNWVEAMDRLLVLWLARAYPEKLRAAIFGKEGQWNALGLRKFVTGVIIHDKDFSSGKQPPALNAFSTSLPGREEYAFHSHRTHKSLTPAVNRFASLPSPSSGSILKKEKEPSEPFKPFVPLEETLHTYYTSEDQPIYQEKTFVIDAANEKNMSAGARRKTEEIQASFEKTKHLQEVPLSQQTFKAYALKPGMDELTIRQGLQTELERMDLASLQKKIVECANFPSKEEKQRLSLQLQLDAELRDQKIASGHLQPLALLDILLQFDPDHLEAIRKENPCLTDEKAKELHGYLLAYFSAQTKKAQLKEAIECLDGSPEGLERCAEVLGKSQTFRLEDHWILSLYQGMTGQLLRSQPDQAKLILEIITEIFKEGAERSPERLQQFFFEFQAGGGKTKVLAVILAVLIKRHGKTPVFVSLPQLFDISKQDIEGALMGFVRRHALPIDLKLNQNPTLQELVDLRNALCTPSNQTLCLVIPPETFHTLWLEYQLAQLFEESDRTEVLDQILAFFEDEAVNLLDEIHRTGSSLLEANFAFGKGIPLPTDILQLYLDIFAFIAHDPTFSQEIKLLERQQKRVSSQTFSQLKEALIEKWGPQICGSETLFAEIQPYLKDFQLPPPKSLEKLYRSSVAADVSLAKRVGALRGLVHRVLPHALSLEEDIDHGPAVDDHNEVERPRNKKEKSLALFEDPELSLALTIKGFLQRGFTDPQQIQKLVSLMQEEVKFERLHVLPGELSPSEKVFFEWQKNRSVKFYLMDLNPSITSSQVWEDLLKAFQNQTGPVLKYLELKPTREVNVFPLKIHSTASRLAYGFHANIAFSATMGPREKYPYFGDEEQYRRDLQFLAKVIQRGSAPPNNRFAWYSSESILGFLQNLDQDLLKQGHLAGIINFGGAAPGKTNLDWARTCCGYFKSHGMPYQGVVCVHQENIHSEKVLYLLTGEDAEPIQLNGSNLKAELKRLNKEHLKLFKIYGPDDTVGLDLSLEPNATMAVTLGEEPALDDLAQAFLRLRLFLKSMSHPEKGQSILWCISETLKPKIRALRGYDASVDIQPKDCFLWALENYHEKMEHEIKAAALQEIEGLFVQIARRKLRGKKGAEQNKLFKEKFLNGFVKDMSYDPFALHGGAHGLQPAKQVLEAFSAECSKRYQIDLEEHPWAVERKKRIIQRTEAILPELESPAIGHPGGQAHQRQRTETQQRTRTHQQTQMKQLQKQAASNGSWNERVEGMYADKELSLMQGNWLDQKDFLRSASEVFELKAVPKSLYLTVDALFAVSSDPWTFEGLKEANHFLIVEERNASPLFIAVSQETALRYFSQIERGEIKKNRKVALVGREGTLVANGKSEQGFSQEELKGMLASDEFKEIGVWFSLMCGQVGRNDTFRELLKQHEREAIHLFQKVIQHQVNPSEREFKRFQFLCAENQVKRTSIEERTLTPSLPQILEAEKGGRRVETLSPTPKHSLPNPVAWTLGRVAGRALPPRYSVISLPPSVPRMPAVPKIVEVPASLPQVAEIPKVDEAPASSTPSKWKRVLIVALKVSIFSGAWFATLFIFAPSVVTLPFLTAVPLVLAVGGGLGVVVICGMWVVKRLRN